ncbi:hypothetical protein K2173_023651 [Erythroxylum novogranatense]|uniref:Single-stranded DNA binding protein Ssb-like OB fold domain-containing protein n=1 Tax=Erythroxylum novogranatense TaxID=1862640 RepID=A0AAV8TP93_9ROSI|nr:hypothetical protein K2173_023651 [Erythroxylum novogranatense]
MVTTTIEKRKPVFVKVEDLKPGTTGHNLTVKVVSSKIVPTYKPRPTVIICNAKIDMFKGSMRLVVDKWGCIEVAELANFIVKESNNLFLVKYELVTVQA